MPDCGFQKRFFILTDGKTDDPNKCILQASIQTQSIRVHTFGIGDGCDFPMVAQTARAGRGSYSIVNEGYYSRALNGHVVRALKKAFEPSLKQCEVWLGFQNSPRQPLDEVFRNQTVSKTTIMSKADFQNIQFGFTSVEDPLTKLPVKLEFSAKDFVQVQDQQTKTALFKMAAHEAIKNKEVKDVVECSMKY